MIHWKMGNDDIGWLLIPGNGKTNVKVSQTTTSLYLADPKTTRFDIYVYAQNAGLDAFDESVWALPGMKLTVNTTQKRVSVESIDPAIFEKEQAVSEHYSAITKVVFELPTSWDDTKPLIDIIPKR